MTFSHTGWLASYWEGVVRDVEAWDDRGWALVVDERKARLVRAQRLPGFVGLRPCSRVISVVTAQAHWKLRGSDKSDRVSAIAAWIVDQTGALIPVAASNGPRLRPADDNVVTAIIPPGDAHSS
jgi:hypothetical protein